MTHTNTRMHTHKHIHVHTQIHDCTHKHMRVHTQIHACTHKHMHVHTQIHACMHTSAGQYIDILIYTVIFIDLVTDTVLLFCYRYIEQSIYRIIGLPRIICAESVGKVRKGSLSAIKVETL